MTKIAAAWLPPPESFIRGLTGALPSSTQGESPVRELRTLSLCGGRSQQQGTKAVPATLWPVADQSTATLMAEMYRRRQEQQMTKTEALRQA